MKFDFPEEHTSRVVLGEYNDCVGRRSRKVLSVSSTERVVKCRALIENPIRFRISRWS